MPGQPTREVFVYSVDIVDCNGGVEEFCSRQVFSRVWWDGKGILESPCQTDKEKIKTKAGGN